jgi:hypothetical protein
MKEYGIYVDTCGEGATYFLLRTKESQRDLAPQDRAPILHTFVALLKFSMYKIIWSVMALACGSLHTVVTFVPNG